MSYLGQLASYADTDFKRRVGQAARRVALDVKAEAFGGGGQPSAALHNARVAFGNRVLLDQVSEETLARAAVCDDVTSAASTDADLYNRLSAIWNALALSAEVA